MPASAVARDPSWLVENLSAVLSETVPETLERERTALHRILDANQSRVVLFGAGNMGRRALRCLRSIGVEPLAFADNNPAIQGRPLDGVTVMRPAEAAAAFGREAAFFVTAWNTHHRYAATAAQLRASGCAAVFPPAAIHWKFPDTFLPFFTLDFPHKVIQQRARVFEAAALLSDPRSRAEYLEHIRWRALGDPERLPCVTDHESYFDPALYRLRENEVFLDCGAYDGDTLDAYLRVQSSALGAVHLIEANPLMWPVLEQRLFALPQAAAPAVTLHRCAVGDRRATLRFDSQGGVGGKLVDSGDVSVECVPIDDLPAASFIKMDIEGAEYEALHGARRSIQENRPILAVCVYHLQNDLWRIPLLIAQWAPDYRYYLRTYEGDGWQAVLYAIPSERAVPGVC